MKANIITFAFAKTLLPLLAVMLQAAGSAAQVSPLAPVYDVVVYGDSSGAVIAVVAAQREGRPVILVNPARFPGGMSASGLGATDFLGQRGKFGGIASEFYDGIAAGLAIDKNFSVQDVAYLVLRRKLEAAKPIVASELQRPAIPAGKAPEKT